MSAPRRPPLLCLDVACAHVFGVWVQALGCEASLLATDWFLCLFATSLPPETAARLWDALLMEGSKLLHRAAVSYTI